MKIISLHNVDVDLIDQVAAFTFHCFRQFAPEWLPTRDAARQEIFKSFANDRRSRVLVNEEGVTLGWVGAITDEHLWEIHPIAVSPDARRQGIGRRLVDDVIAMARQAGAVAVWAGTSDETGATSYSSIDLYQNPTHAFRGYAAVANHPVHFWHNIGFSLVGVMPDEEGLGKPGIHFAKRIV